MAQLGGTSPIPPSVGSTHPASNRTRPCTQVHRSPVDEADVGPSTEPCSQVRRNEDSEAGNRRSLKSSVGSNPSSYEDIPPTEATLKNNRHCDEYAEDQQWEIVTDPKADDAPVSTGRGFSSNFNLTLGWGKWKYTVFSWDVNVRYPNDNGIEAEEDDDEDGEDGGKKAHGEGNREGRKSKDEEEQKTEIAKQ